MLKAKTMSNNTRRLPGRPSVLLSAILFLAPAHLLVSDEMIPRSLLIDMARQQFSVMCQSETFVSCMGFSTSQCTDLSETAVKQCLLPLPAEISPSELDNDALEACPQQVFEDAGFTEEKAGMCFDQAMEAG